MAADGGLRSRIVGGLVGPHWQAIETGGTGRGIPDLEGCWQGHSTWIECKATTGWVVGLRPEQIAWLQRRCRVGGSAWIAVRRQGRKWWRGGARKGTVDELWIWHGSLAAHIAEHGLDCGLEPALYLQAPWDWQSVGATLFPGWGRGPGGIGPRLGGPGAPGEALEPPNK